MCALVGFSACKKETGGTLEIIIPGPDSEHAQIRIHCHNGQCEPIFGYPDADGKFVVEMEDDGEIHVQATLTVRKSTEVQFISQGHVNSGPIFQYYTETSSGAATVELEKGKEESITLEMTLQ